MQASFARLNMRFVACVLGLIAGTALLLSPFGRGSPGLLGANAADYPEDLTGLVRQAQLAPEDSEVALTAATALTEQGRASGDATLVSAASELLAPHLTHKATSNILTQAAIAAQYLHDFNRALELLDRNLAINPNDVQALLTRANILVVQGRLETASTDCRRLATADRFDIALLCDTTVNALGPEAMPAHDRLRALLEQRGLDPALTGYGWSLLGEIALFQGDQQRALDHLQTALAHDPEGLRIRMLLADALLALDRPGDVLSILADTPDTDPLLVRKAIAYRQLGQTKELDEAVTILEGRFAQNISQGEGAHAREEARFYLEVLNNPVFALDRAQVNWSRQREYEDAWLLIEAAEAAGQTGRAAPVREWMTAQNVTAPALMARLPERES